MSKNSALKANAVKKIEKQTEAKRKGKRVNRKKNSHNYVFFFTHNCMIICTSRRWHEGRYLMIEL